MEAVAPRGIPRPIMWGLVGTVLIVAIAIALSFVPMEKFVDDASLWAIEWGAAAGLIYALAYIVATLLCLPVLPLTIGAGVLFGAIKGALIVSTATTTAATVAFLIGRYAARKKITEISHHYPKFDAVDRAVGKEGWKIIALLRVVLFIPFGVSNYFYGITAIRILPYIVATHFAMLPGTLFYCWVGSIGKAGIMRALGLGEADIVGWEYPAVILAVAAKIGIVMYVTKIVKRSIRE